jgi:hypothetical protein
LIVNYKEQIIQLKIVYYGCAMSGKTTTLRYLFKKFSNEKNLTSIETTTGRTLFFDFGVLSMKGGDWLIKIALYSATGQDFYAATRPATLTGADGIIFIIDSQKNLIDDNLNSWLELKSFYGKNIKELPLVLCLNKQDLKDLSDQETLIEKFEVDNFSNFKMIETEAITGKGVIKTFKYMMEFLFPTIKIS